MHDFEDGKTIEPFPLSHKSKEVKEHFNKLGVSIVMAVLLSAVIYGVYRVVIISRERAIAKKQVHLFQNEPIDKGIELFSYESGMQTERAGQ